MQFKSLKDIADMFRSGILEIASWKDYVEHTRVASYPNVEQVHAERASVECSWPAYEHDFLLNRPSSRLISSFNIPETPCGDGPFVFVLGPSNKAIVPRSNF